MRDRFGNIRDQFERQKSPHFCDFLKDFRVYFIIVILLGAK